MKDRIKQIRKMSPHGKTQDTFSKFLGIPKSNLASYEIGRRIPSDAVVQLICQKCNIDENWLRTGKGEPTIKMTRSQEMGVLISELMNLPDDSMKKRFIEAMLKLDEKELEVLAKIADSLKEGG